MIKKKKQKFLINRHFNEKFKHYMGISNITLPLSDIHYPLDVTIGSIFPIFKFFKLALKDAEDNFLQLFYGNICSKMNNKVAKR
jgi:hypothetical protein